ncbi:MAG: hypothetical protein RL276_341 [Bacteroidota bacterium]
MKRAKTLKRSAACGFKSYSFANNFINASALTDCIYVLFFNAPSHNVSLIAKFGMPLGEANVC